MIQANNRTQDAILSMGDVPESPRHAPQAQPVADSRANDISPTAPDSYRFTPRSQRGDAEMMETHAHHQYRYVRSLEMQPTGEEGAERDWFCERLSLQHNKLNSIAVAHICSLLRNTTQLTTLCLGSNPLGDTGAALVGRALHQCKCLQTLGLQGCGIGSRGFRHLAKGCATNVSLRSLWLFANAAADEGAARKRPRESTAGAVTPRRTRRLPCHPIPAPSAAPPAAALAAQSAAPLIYYFDARPSPLSADLAAALRSSPLEELGLERNNIGVPGVQALAFAIGSGNTKLLWLRLQHNPGSGAAGAAALARALWEQPRLTKLQLRDTGIGAAGAAALSEALRQNKVWP